MGAVLQCTERENEIHEYMYNALIYCKNIYFWCIQEGSYSNYCLKMFIIIVFDTPSCENRTN